MDLSGSSELDPHDPANITISVVRYNILLEAENELARLEANGVDNWEGYYVRSD